MIKKTLTGGSMTVDFDGLTYIQIAGAALFINDTELLPTGYGLEIKKTIKNFLSHTGYNVLKHNNAINRRSKSNSDYAISKIGLPVVR